MSMAALLKELQTYLEADLVTDKEYLVTVQVIDMFRLGDIIQNNWMPGCFISPINEDERRGPFANTSRQAYNLRLRLVAQDWQTEAYTIEPVSGSPTNVNLSVVIKRIKLLLKERKKLLTDTFEFSQKFQVTYMNVLETPDNGNFTVRDILIEYTELELDTGMTNNQDSLNPAYQFE